MSGILGLGSSGSAGLSQDVIDQLKEVEREAQVVPIETQIEDWDLEVEQFAEIETKMNELLAAAKKFDLYSTDENAFNAVYAKTAGTSASFDATDTSNINPGTVTVDIKQLAQKDVHMANQTISDKTAVMGAGTLEIKIGEDTLTFETEGKTYEQLVKEMNNFSKLDVALEQVGDSEYRMIIKSSESGVENNMTISGTAADALGGFKETQNAQNLEATIDGIDYNLSENNVVMSNGLIINALETGISSISIQRDTANIQTSFQELIDIYNGMVDTLYEYTQSADSKIDDPATLRTIQNDLKNILFGSSYGQEGDKSIFNYGIELTDAGYLILDSATFSEAVAEDYNGLKSLLVGSAENEGIGTRLKSYVDESTLSGGLLALYGEDMETRRSTLEEEKEKAIEALDLKYEQMAAQFAAYTVIITKFENSFSGLATIIAQSTAQN